MQELPNWIVSIISVTVGGLIPITYLIIRDYYQGRKRKNEIKDMVSVELEDMKGILNLVLMGSKNEQVTIEIHKEKSALFGVFPLDISFYSNIGYDILVKSFPTKTLYSLQQTYRVIRRLNKSTYTRGDFTLIFVEPAREALHLIEESLRLLNE